MRAAGRGAVLRRRPRPAVGVRGAGLRRAGAGPRPAARAPPAGADRPRPDRPRPARPRRPADLRHRAVAGPAQPLAGGTTSPRRRRASTRSVDELDGTMAEIRAAIFELQQRTAGRPGGGPRAARRRRPAGHRGPRPAAATCGSAAPVDELPRRPRARPASPSCANWSPTSCGTPGAARVTVLGRRRDADVVRRRHRRRRAGCPPSPCAAAWPTSPTAPSGGAGGSPRRPAPSGTEVRWTVPRGRGPLTGAQSPVRSRSSVARIAAWVRRSSPSLASRWLV